MKFFEDLSTTKQVDRWKNVLRVLQGLSPHARRKHWDMSVFGEKTECGTVACAAGHCGMDPWFRRRGFQLKFTTDMFGEEMTNLGEDGGELVEDFFGEVGAREIFFNGVPRPVGEVIREVKAHIAYLKDES